ncbi:hypothetical protein BCR32DRAFT_326709, partial [Anaeromyces robustus]
MIEEDISTTNLIKIKEKKINEQEALINKYNKKIKEMEEERKNTITAHQNRIKQLQDKYLIEQKEISGNYKLENEQLLRENKIKEEEIKKLKNEIKTIKENFKNDYQKQKEIIIDLELKMEKLNKNTTELLEKKLS